MAQYTIINVETIQKRIEALEKWNYMQEGATTYRSPMHLESSRIQIIQNKEVILELKQILFQSTPLLPEVSKAYDAGMFHKELSQMFDNPKGRYVNNLKLDI